MQNHDEAIQEVELTIQQAKNQVAVGDAYQRLLSNKDFQLVIDDGYFTRESRRLTLLSADKNLTDNDRDNIMHSLRAIGELHTFFLMITQRANQLRKDIEVYEQGLAEMHAEGATEEGL